MMAILAYLLIAVGAFFSLMNWIALALSIRGPRNSSRVPLAGAVPLGSGLALLPATRPFAWVAIIADLGTLELIVALPWIAWEIWSTSGFNLLHTFTHDDSGRHIVIQLYRRKKAVISVRFDPPALLENGARVISFGHNGKWAVCENGFTISGYGRDRKLLLSNEGRHFQSVETGRSDDVKEYESFDGLRFQKS